MKMLRRAMLAALALATMIAPFASKADPIETNPFGTLELTSVTAPAGATPGRATLTIKNSVRDGGTVYFGFRIMGTEDIEMTGFSLPHNATTNPCIVSDFAGNNSTGGWQGAPAFGAGQDTPAGTSANSHMRMVGGYLRPACGDLIVRISFRSLPLVAYYACFFGTNAAPWHNNYDEAPWSTIPTGGTAGYQNWWNLWGQFDTLGYSNAVTYTGV